MSRCILNRAVITLVPFQNDKQGNSETQYYQEHEHNRNTGRNHYIYIRTLYTVKKVLE